MGPYETSREAFLAAPRPRDGENLTDANLRALTAALEGAGVTPGAYGERIVAWLAGMDGETVAVVADWSQQAYEAGLAAGRRENGNRAAT